MRELVYLPHWMKWRSIVEEFVSVLDAMRIGGDIEPMFTVVTGTFGEPWDTGRWISTEDDQIHER